MQLSALSLAMTRVMSGAYTPSALFAAGEQGGWYDPSDRTTLYQDAAGTTPVTAMEQPVGLMLDKSKGLVLGPELVPSGTFSGDLTGWVPNAGGTIAIVSGELEVAGAGANYFGGVTPAFATVVGRRYVATGVCRRGTTTGNAYIASGAWNSKTVSASTNTPVQFVFEAVSTSTKLSCLVSGATTGTAYFDNISVRELPGNHAYQSTSASRPVLSARVNMLTNTPFAGAGAGSPGTFPTGWSDVFNTGTLASVISERLTLSASGTRWVAGQSLTFAANTTYEAKLTLYANTGVVLIQLFTWNQGFGGTETAFVNGVSVNPQTYVPAAGDTIVYRLASGATGGTATVRFGIGCSYTTTGTVTISRPDIRPANDGIGLPSYQRVVDSVTYDTAGFPAYLKFDGIDDSLVTNSIDFTSTDKMTVFAGVRYLGTADGIISELSADRNANNGSFTFSILAAPVRGFFASKGTLSQTAVAEISGPYINHVLTGLGDIAGDRAVLRSDSVAVNTNPYDQGTGTYGNYPLYIGSRAGTSNRYNGHIYSLIVRGAQSSASQISSVERYVNGKTKAWG